MSQKANHMSNEQFIVEGHVLLQEKVANFRLVISVLETMRRDGKEVLLVSASCNHH